MDFYRMYISAQYTLGIEHTANEIHFVGLFCASDVVYVLKLAFFVLDVNVGAISIGI